MLSETIHAPQNKFTDKKWHQNIIKKPFSEFKKSASSNLGKNLFVFAPSAYEIEKLLENLFSKASYGWIW